MTDSSTLTVVRDAEEKPATLPHTLTTGGSHSTTTTLGFLSIVTDSTGVFGGYLVTNAWGRPLEFRISTAVQPNRVQQILYGPTLTEYLHAELIGKTLIEKTTSQPSLIITDSLPALGLRTRVHIPALSIVLSDDDGYAEMPSGRVGQSLTYAVKHAADLPTFQARLEQVDPAVDLTEPFARIREAMAEARKMGVTNRAA